MYLTWEIVGSLEVVMPLYDGCVSLLLWLCAIFGSCQGGDRGSLYPLRVMDGHQGWDSTVRCPLCIWGVHRTWDH